MTSAGPASAPPFSDLPDVEGVSHRRVRARGLDFHVAEAGEGDDVVLCLHGWPQHWYEWRHLMPALAAAGHRVLAMDLRGFGWSDAPPRGYEKENMADDVLAVLDELGLERVKLVGHDWGGWIGFLLALKAPKRFERYLALNILHPWVGLRDMAPNLWRFWYQWMILSPGIGYGLHRSGRFIPRVLVGGSSVKEVWDDETVHAFSDSFTRPDYARAGVQMYRVFNLKEVPPMMRGRYLRMRLTVPTLVLFGEDDFAIRPELLDGHGDHADEFRVERVHGCGHFIADERPDLVAERAVEFFGAAADTTATDSATADHA
jgi:pimeloyl-ACP methyl ester carboxylesterase